MKHSILEKALRSYVSKADASEMPDVLDAIEELAVTKECAADVLEAADTCLLMPETVWCEFCAGFTYDMYGRLARQTNNNVTYDSFRSAVEHTFNFVDKMPNDIFLSVFELNRDLWNENERTDYNNPDGSYNTSKV